MFDFTNRVKKVINELAPKEAKRLGHESFGPEHILLGLLKAQDSVAIKILQNLNIGLNELRKEIEKRCDKDSVTLLIDPASHDKVQRVLEMSREEARRLKHNYVGSEHILLAILRENTSIAAAALGTFSVTYQVVRNELNQTLGIPQGGGPFNFRIGQQTRKESSKTPMLDEFARNLSKMAAEKSVDPVIGRSVEINRVIQILSRKTKNNPILIGEAGVGKTAIVEGLAQRILNKDIPESMFENLVFSLDIAALIAGTKYRGEFEDRLKKIMKEIQSNSSIILFIDEIHTIIGAGAAEGAMDAANILKPALARGEVQCIGATTLKEYKKYIERDSALERRFQTIIVDEPSVEDTMRILMGLKKSYEKYHSVIYEKSSIKAAVRLSNKFVTDRYLPDKAIDILDEAGSRARLQNSVIPKKIKSYEGYILKMIKEKNERVRNQEYEKAAKLRDQIVAMEQEYLNKISEWRKNQKEKKLFISEADIASIMSDWTSIPLQQLELSESQKLVDMEQELATRVVGQNKAIEKIAKAVRRSRSGLKSTHKPIGSFIFLGPTGVGKTQLAKSLAEFMFGSPESLIRFDMSEYMELHSVSKFIGSPPGYVGYEEGGLLTEAVRRKPYSILLFDEIEKAHPDVQNILLQILDEGELTDTMGHRVDFKETIVIMTSNIGARQLLKGGRLGFGENNDKSEAKKDKLMEEMKRFFSPEFLNRVDDVIVFESLLPKDIVKIVEILIEEINKSIISKDIHLVLSRAAFKYIASEGYDEKFGARPLKRVIQREIEDVLSLMILKEKIKGPSVVQIDHNNKKLDFKLNKLSSQKLKKLQKKYLAGEQSVEDLWSDYESETTQNISQENNGKNKEHPPTPKTELAPI